MNADKRYQRSGKRPDKQTARTEFDCAISGALQERIKLWERFLGSAKDSKILAWLRLTIFEAGFDADHRG
jgi:hypothetical protein